jgi:hypothetical protein
MFCGVVQLRTVLVVTPECPRVGGRCGHYSGGGYAGPEPAGRHRCVAEAQIGPLRHQPARRLGRRSRDAPGSGQGCAASAAGRSSGLAGYLSCGWTPIPRARIGATASEGGNGRAWKTSNLGSGKHSIDGRAGPRLRSRGGAFVNVDHDAGWARRGVVT